MRTSPFRRILSFLALLGTVRASGASTTECIAQAWVRVPDLSPDTVVQGDARVKISAGCPAVETVSLGLRLKERSFMKTPHSPEDKNLVRAVRHPTDLQETSPWAFPTTRFENRSDDVRLKEIVGNKASWLVREEERIVFETAQVIHVGAEVTGDRVVVQDFSVLIPSTNFPPALDYLNSGFILSPDALEIVDMESMYEYFIRVPFLNGTTEDISAGFTGFQPLYNPTDTSRWPSSESVRLEGKRYGFPGEVSFNTNYTAHVSEVLFTEDTENQAATVVITRTGPARTFTAPLIIRACVWPTLSSKWTAEYDMPGSLPMHRPDYVLRSTLKDVEDAKRNSMQPSCRFGHNIKVSMPNSTSDEIDSHAIVTTTSEAVTIPIEINRRQTPNFETYYYTLANSLRIMLETPRAEDETADPDDPSAEAPTPWVPDLPDDEEPWVPWEKARPGMQHPRSWALYSGYAPVVVRPVAEVPPLRPCAHQAGDMQEFLSGEWGCEQRLIHYLDEGARGPTFVDSSAVDALLAEEPLQRQLRAPILTPVVSSPPDGEEHIYRYYRRLHRNRPLIYVGETWARKVSNRD